MIISESTTTSFGTSPQQRKRSSSETLKQSSALKHPPDKTSNKNRFNSTTQRSRLTSLDLVNCPALPVSCVPHTSQTQLQTSPVTLAQVIANKATARAGVSAA